MILYERVSCISIWSLDYDVLLIKFKFEVNILNKRIIYSLYANIAMYIIFQKEELYEKS